MTQIERLRAELSALLAKNCSLSDPQMVKVSEELDHLVLDEMRKKRSAEAPPKETQRRAGRR